MSILSELKRRKVYRAGITYLVVAWLALQIADVLGDNLDLPDTLFRALLILVVLGFPIVLALAWIFERTPEGLQLDSGVGQTDSQSASQYVQLVLIVVLSVAVGWLVFDRLQQPADEIVSDLDKSIAVLPFSSRSAEADDLYFVEGMHDDILIQLAGLNSLDRVISRTTIERYRGSALSIAEIAEELGVATVLEGAVQRAGDRVRINMKLYDARADVPLWTRSWDKQLTIENLFAIQSELTGEIVTALDVTLLAADREKMSRPSTDSLKAFELHAAGRQQMALRTSPGLLDALASFEAAVEADPSYADAWVGIADAWALQSEYVGTSMSESFEPRQRALEEALRLDPDSARAYASLAMLERHQGRNEEAERLFKRALELNPSETNALHWYTLLLRDTDRTEEARRLVTRARDTDPLAPILIAAEASIYEAESNEDGMRAILLNGIRRIPEFQVFYELMGYSYVRVGQFDEALRWFDEAVRREPTSPDPRAAQCGMLVELDMVARGKTCLDALSADFPQRYPVNQSELHFQLMALSGRVDDFLVPVGFAVDLNESARIGVAAAYLMNNDLDESQKILESLSAELFEGPVPVLRDGQLDMGLLSSVILAATNQTERAEALFAATLDGLSDGKEVNFITALFRLAQNRYDDAEAALSSALERGDIERWWLLRSPVFQSDDMPTGWVEAVAALETEITRQRLAYEANPELALPL